MKFRYLLIDENFVTTGSNDIAFVKARLHDETAIYAIDTEQCSEISIIGENEDGPIFELTEIKAAAAEGEF